LNRLLGHYGVRLPPANYGSALKQMRRISFFLSNQVFMTFFTYRA
jgi:hypothetical protein